MKIHYVIPTINFEAMKNKLVASLGEFEGVRDYISFGVCFQKYTKEQIKYVVDEFKKHKITLYYIEKEYHFKEEEIPFLEMRDDCAMLNPTADIYGSMDDDDLFNSTYPYCISDVVKGIIKYFETYSNCGAIMVTNFKDLGVIRPNISNFPISTALGIYLRNIYEGGHIMPKEKLNLVGLQEDIIYVRQRTNDNYFDAIAWTPCGAHTEIKPRAEQGLVKYGWIKIKPVEGTVLYELYHALWNKQYNFNKMRFENNLPKDLVIPKRK
jgi:hypothetical protein